ncbi:DinB family protein [Rhodovibrionaceae bacterium A322]
MSPSKTDLASLPRMFTHYKAWANRLTFEIVGTLSHEELTKRRETNFKSILHTLNHVYVVDDIFKAHLQGRPHGYSARNTESSPSLADLWQATQAMDQWYCDLAASLSETKLNETIEFEFVGGGQGVMTRLEIILHVVNHGTYHRGFVGDMLYQIPTQSPANDLPVFLRDVWHGRQ